MHSCLCRLLQDRLSFKVVAFLQAGLLAFNPVGGFLNHGLQFFGIAHEEAAGIVFTIAGRSFPRATQRKVEVFKATGGLPFPDGRGNGSNRADVAGSK